MEDTAPRQALSTASESSISTLELLDSLQHRANSVLEEFRTYQACLKSKHLSKHVELRIFRRGVEAEQKNLETIAKKDHAQDQHLPNTGSLEAKDQGAKRLQALRSSNLPFYEAVWATAKQCTAIRALGKRLYWNGRPPHTGTSLLHVEENGHKSRRKQLNNALVDVVADDGALWIKVSIVTAKHLAFEIAKEGYAGYADESDSEEREADRSSSAGRDQVPKLEIVRLAEDLRAASLATRVKYRHPEVKFMLPRIQEGKDDHIDAILADLRSTGAVVLCGEACNINICDGDDAGPHGPIKFDDMVPSSGLPTLTMTVNIDCTILLALISDISHIRRPELPPSPSNSSGTYHTAIVKQIESEEESPLLPSELYPILSGRRLVCTSLAAQRMREIVQTMGTKSEAARAEILIGEGEYYSKSAQNLRDAWGQLSCYTMSDTTIFPIEVSDFAFPSDLKQDSQVTTIPSQYTEYLAQQLATRMNLSPINASVFMYAWYHDIVTLTSNRVVAAGIERHLNDILDEQEKGGQEDQAGRSGKAEGNQNHKKEEFVGPKMYVVETARSLVGKEKSNGLRP